MAIYHLSAKTISRASGGSAAAKADYIQREGKYAGGKSELMDIHSGNMPEWAHRPADYWIAADRYERANGRLCKQVEFALPIELTKEQQAKLATEFAIELTRGERLPFTLAIHSGKGTNPHCHLMISERVNDGLGRAAETWFRRHDVRRPEAGGARKTEALKPQEWLEQTRGRWAELANRALDRSGVDARIDHRSLEAQGVERVPTMHLGPNVIEMGHRPRRGGFMPDKYARHFEVKKANAKLIDLAAARKRIEADRKLAIVWEAPKAQERAAKQAKPELPPRAAPGDFVRDRLTGKEKEVRNCGPGAPSKGTPAREPAAGRLYIKVPYDEKDAAKALGAKYDPAKKQWYVPQGVDTAVFSQWLQGRGSKSKAPQKRRRLENPYTQPLRDAREAAKDAYLAWEKAAQPYWDKLKADVERRDQLHRDARGTEGKIKEYESLGFVKRLIRKGERNDLQEKLMRIEEELGAIPEAPGVYTYCLFCHDRVQAIIEPIMAREHPELTEQRTATTRHAKELEKQEAAWAVERRHELDEMVKSVSCHLARDPDFNPRGAFEDQQRFDIAERLIRKSIAEGEQFRGAEDPKLEKIKEKALAEYEREQGQEIGLG